MKPKSQPSSSGSRRPKAAPARGCPIVGIGASAGGLEAFTQLLKQLPLDTGFGFVLVQHLDPQHESALTALLARATAMPVREVTNNLRVEANHVYIIPPNTSLGIARGVLKLQPRSRNGTALRSIDFFFEALAKDQRERAIGVVLSGTATDGTLGLEAIKAEGGLTFAQDDSAKYDSMPRSAAAAGCVDLVLAPEAIARELARIAQHPFVAGSAPNGAAPLPARGRITAKTAARTEAALARGTEPEAPGPADEDGYKKILLLLRNHCGVDFSLYKPSTIQRRIMRRTVLNRKNTLKDYAAFLLGNSKELDALYSDSLIGVTSFFRNADAFDVLQHKIFPRLLDERGDEPLRVWVLGCSTGQEAYSIAIAFTEAAEKVSRARKLQVFATDLNEANLNKARNGLYAKSLAEDVSPARLKRFFVEEDGGYRVVKSLRESVVFARQNIISDPPFSRMDLISCRNLMIYLEPSLQKKVIPTFHYALKPEGYLFLGASESVGAFTDLFQPVDKRQKIFSKRAAPAQAFHLPVSQERVGRSLPDVPPAALPPGKKTGGVLEAFRSELNAEREADRVTVNQFAPPAVLINADMQILQFRGPTGAYLEPPTGKANFDLLKMARDGLMLPLRATINRAKQENATVRHEAVPVLLNGKTRIVNLEVVPLKNVKERCFLVLFEDAEKDGRAAPADAPPRDESPGTAQKTLHAASRKEDSDRIVGLERDLAETRDYLESIQEQQEAANEELQASNEEGQSANEELQSLNEELETSKEELESTNEELTTVNEEMVSRNTELNRLNGDLTNFQVSTKFIVVLLGRDLAIRRFSAEAEKLFRFHASDLGRPIGAVRHTLRVPDLSAIIAKVIAGGREEEREVQDRDDRWYSLRVRPYLTLDHKVDGAVLVLADINAAKEARHEVVRTLDFAEAIIGTVRDPFLVLDADLRVQKANQAFLTAFKISAAELENRILFELDHGQWDIPRLRKLLLEILPRHSSFNDFEVTHHFKTLGQRTLLLNARRLKQGPGHREKILLGIQDVTERLQTQARVRRSELRFRRLFETAQDGILILDPATRKITDANPFIVKLLGYSRKQLLEKELWQIGLIKDEAASQKAFRLLKKQGFIRYEDLPLKSKNGRLHQVEFVGNLYAEDGQAVIQCNIRDITERRRAEASLRASEERFRAAAGIVTHIIWTNSAQGLMEGAQPGWGGFTGQTPAEYRGYGWVKAVHPDDAPPTVAAWERAVAAKKIFEFEHRVRRHDGAWRRCAVRAVPLLGSGGAIREWVGVHTDITERKREEANLSLLASVSLDLVRATGVDGMMRIVGAKIGAHLDLSACAFAEVNAVAREITVSHDWHRHDFPSLAGVYRKADFLKKEFIRQARAGEIIVVRDTAADARTTPGEFAALKIRSFICVPLIRDGAWRFALCLYHAAAYDWREDEIELARELTGRIWTRLERLRVVAELSASEARYRTLFSSMDEGFCIVELLCDERGRCVDFRYLETNPAFARHSGIRDAVGKRIREIAPPFEGHWFETYGRVARTGKPVRFTDESKTLGRWFDCYAFRIGGQGSRKIAVLFSDVSARKQAEAALNAARAQLAEHAAQLEKMVGVRTGQLTAANRRLKASVDTVTQAREKYRVLLAESEFMQKKLRSLAREILTAQEDERRNISRELHDEVVQTLVGINVELSALGHAAGLGPRALKAKIARTQRLVEKSVNAVHRFARELRPAVLDDLGLIPALQSYMKGVAARRQLQINLTASAAVEQLDAAARTVLYRVVQEALTNVARHAQASVVNVTISEISGAIRLEVQDNGKSFQVLQTLSAKTNQRLGLLGMRERVEIVGGTLHIDSSPGFGTTVRTEVPFPPKDPA